MDSGLKILQHSLGCDEYGHRAGGRSARNHFCTGPGSSDHAVCLDLVERGLMTRRGPTALTGGDDLFLVTPAGEEYVAKNSPRRPRQTRSQKRYAHWLSVADCFPGWKFGDWLKTKAYKPYIANLD